MLKGYVRGFEVESVQFGDAVIVFIPSYVADAELKILLLYCFRKVLAHDKTID